jgi:hypothetical protein
MLEKRFFLRRRPVWSLLLALLTAWRTNSYIEIVDGKIRARMGLLFNETFPLSEVTDVRTRQWPWLMGVGWRTDFRGHIGLVGGYGEVVEMHFRDKRGVRLLPMIPWPVVPCDRLSVSVEDVKGLLEALGAPVSPSDQ